MIRLTRLRNSNPLYINPDHIERLDQYHETTVHLFNGDEFVVVESADRIVELITEQRARILALASRLAAGQAVDAADPSNPAEPTPLVNTADAGTTGAVSSLIALLDEPEDRVR